MNEALCLLEATSSDPFQCPICYVNAAFFRLTGYEAAELQGQKLCLFDARPTGSPAYGRREEARDAAGPMKVQRLNYHKDGSALWVEQSLTPIRDEKGGLTHWVCLMRDVTATHQAEARRQMQAALLEEAQDAIFVCDPGGFATYWNKSAEQLFGWTTGEVIDRKIDGLLFAPGDPVVREALHNTVEHGKWVGELKPKSRTGDTLIVASRWTLIPGRDAGRPDTILVVNTDVTKRKQLEEQLLRSQRLDSIGMLAGGIVHDLNNVLNPILMAVGLLRQQPLGPEARQYLDTLAQNAQRGADMLKQLLTFARGAAQERQYIPPQQFIRSIETLLRETFPPSIKIHVETEEELWAISGNTTQLEQVLMNLCVNARDVMPEGGKLTITSHNVRLDEDTASFHHRARPGRYVAIKVTDTGHGMPPEVLDKVFDPFFTTKKPGHGTGLGLATVHSIVEGLDGFVHAQSWPGKGTFFAVFLPAVEAASLEHEARPPTVPIPGQGQTLLLADDEKDILALSRAVLERHGYRILTARNGEEVVDLFRKHADEIAVVITDIMMPRMDGFATIQALFEMKPEVKILAISGFVNKEGLVKLARLGTHAFLPKPFTMGALLAALEPLVGASEDPSDPSKGWCAAYENDRATNDRMHGKTEAPVSQKATAL